MTIRIKLCKYDLNPEIRHLLFSSFSLFHNRARYLWVPPLSSYRCILTCKYDKRCLHPPELNRRMSSRYFHWKRLFYEPLLLGFGSFWKIRMLFKVNIEKSVLKTYSLKIFAWLEKWQVLADTHTRKAVYL